jgi:hypothetical protein
VNFRAALKLYMYISITWTTLQTRNYVGKRWHWDNHMAECLVCHLEEGKWLIEFVNLDLELVTKNSSNKTVDKLDWPLHGKQKKNEQVGRSNFNWIGVHKFFFSLSLLWQNAWYLNVHLFVEEGFSGRGKTVIYWLMIMLELDV